MSFILLISDFQSDSYKTGILKTELRNALNGIEIIDITHQIRLNNTIEAAFVCKQIQVNESQNNIVLVKVGYCKEILLYPHLQNLYIFPNNGLLSMVFEGHKPSDVRILPAGELVEAIQAFNENRLDSLPLAGSNQIVRYARSAQIGSDMAIAECLFTDGHGNCYFNINREQFMAFTAGKRYQIRIQHYTGQVFTTISDQVNDVDPGEALFRFSSSAYLKLQINLGNARQLFRIKDDTKIIIEVQ